MQELDAVMNTQSSSACRSKVSTPKPSRDVRTFEHDGAFPWSFPTFLAKAGDLRAKSKRHSLRGALPGPGRGFSPQAPSALRLPFPAAPPQPWCRLRPCDCSGLACAPRPLPQPRPDQTVSPPRTRVWPVLTDHSSCPLDLSF